MSSMQNVQDTAPKSFNSKAIIAVVIVIVVAIGGYFMMTSGNSEKAYLEKCTELQNSLIEVQAAVKDFDMFKIDASEAMIKPVAEKMKKANERFLKSASEFKADKAPDKYKEVNKTLVTALELQMKIQSDMLSVLNNPQQEKIGETIIRLYENTKVLDEMAKTISVDKLNLSEVLKLRGSVGKLDRFVSQVKALERNKWIEKQKVELVKNGFMIGGIKPLMTMTEVEQIYGKPASEKGDNRGGFITYYYNNGVSVNFMRKNKKSRSASPDDFVVASVELISDNSVKATGDIGIGSHSLDVTSIYGNPNHTRDFGSSTTYMYTDNTRCMMTFSVGNDGKVFKISCSFMTT